MDEQLLKSLSGAIDAAIKELATIDTLAKSDISLQDAKLRPEGANGDLPGHSAGESVLKPEDAKKAEAKSEPEEGTEHTKKGENPFAAGKDKDDKKDDKSKDKDSDEDDDDDMDDEKAEKMKAKMKKYEDKKAAKASAPSMTKSESINVEALTKSITAQVEEVMAKSFGDRLGQLEGMIAKLVGAPVARSSVSGLAPLAKSSEDVQPAAAAATPALTHAGALNQLFDMQRGGDSRVDSQVISRVEMKDYSVLAERGINLK